MSLDTELQTLCDLDGERFQIGGGYWTKFDVKMVEPTAAIPHGIRYSLTLHDRYNKRLFGFDNAHAVQSARKKYRARRLEWDHRHDNEMVTEYEFDSPGKLLEDFWNAVNQIISSK